jgi:uncharacterized protein (TIGR03083 family)
VTKALGGKDFWLAALRAEAAAFRLAVAEAEPAAEVPSCPGWTVADLVVHLGGRYGETAGHVARGESGAPELVTPTPPAEANLLGWWDGQLAGLLALLEQLDPDLPAWNWAPQTKTVNFWNRRMAHETAVHRWDAQFASINAEPIETKLALDGIAEVLDTWLPAGRGLGPDGLTGVVGLVATDAGHEFFVRQRAEGGIAVLDTDTILDTEPHERVVASGTASDILLALYGRVDLDVLEVSGDVRLLAGLRVG